MSRRVYQSTRCQICKFYKLITLWIPVLKMGICVNCARRLETELPLNIKEELERIYEIKES